MAINVSLQYNGRLLPDIILLIHCYCVRIYECVLIPFILDVGLGLWTYKPGSHGRKVTQDFSTFLLWLPSRKPFKCHEEV